MNKEKKEGLTQVRDDMVREDLEKEKTAPNMSAQKEKEILGENKDKIRSIFPKKLIGVGIAAILGIALITQVPKFFSMGSSNPSERKEAPLVDMKADEPKGDDAPAEEAQVDGNMTEGQAPIADESTVYPTSPKSINEKIVYHFTYSIQTLKFDETEKNLRRLIDKTGSYISNARVFTEYDSKNAEYLVRVPRDKSTEFQTQMNGLGTIVSHEISSDDFTKYYRDLETDKLTKEIKIKKLQELLAKAEKFDDIIKIQEELSRAESEEIQLGKEMAEIDHDVQYQFFQLNIREVKKTDEPANKKPTFLDRMRLQFNRSIEDVKYFATGLILFLIRNWILILLLAIVLPLIIKKIINDRRY